MKDKDKGKEEGESEGCPSLFLLPSSLISMQSKSRLNFAYLLEKSKAVPELGNLDDLPIHKAIEADPANFEIAIRRSNPLQFALVNSLAGPEHNHFIFQSKNIINFYFFIGKCFLIHGLCLLKRLQTWLEMRYGRIVYLDIVGQDLIANIKVPLSKHLIKESAC